MVQNNHIEDSIKKYGRAYNYEIKKQKKIARESATTKRLVRRIHGIKAKLFVKKRRSMNCEKIKEKKQQGIKNIVSNTTDEPLPHFLLDRDAVSRPKIISNVVKEKRKERVSKYAVPIPRVKGISEIEAFRSITTGKKGKNQWKRMVTKPCFVGDNYTRKPPKYERFIRPMALRYKSAHVVHQELNTTFKLPIIGLKKNPHSDVYTNLGVLSKGTIIEVNVSDLGLVAPNGKIIWGKYAQITNNPENDGCVNAVLLV